MEVVIISILVGLTVGIVYVVGFTQWLTDTQESFDSTSELSTESAFVNKGRRALDEALDAYHENIRATYFAARTTTRQDAEPLKRWADLEFPNFWKTESAEARALHNKYCKAAEEACGLKPESAEPNLLSQLPLNDEIGRTIHFPTLYTESERYIWYNIETNELFTMRFGSEAQSVVADLYVYIGEL